MAYVVMLVDNLSTPKSVEMAVSSVMEQKKWDPQQCWVLSGLIDDTDKLVAVHQAGWRVVNVPQGSRLNIIEALRSWLGLIAWRMVPMWPSGIRAYGMAT